MVKISHMTIKTMKKDGRSKNKINSKPSAIKMFTYLGPLFLKKGPHWPIPRIKPWWQWTCDTWSYCLGTLIKSCQNVLAASDITSYFHSFAGHNSTVIHQSIPAAPRPPWTTAGHLTTLSVQGVGHLQILRCLGARHLPTPGPILNFSHACGFLPELYNHIEDFTGNASRLAHLSRTGKNWRGW